MKLPQIKILGLGGAGSNCARLFASANDSIEAKTAAMDTDYKTLADADKIGERLLITSDSTAQFIGSDNEEILGLKAAVLKIFTDTDMLIIFAGMGGNTGSELAGSIARMASRKKIPTTAFCIMPLEAEGAEKCSKARRDFADVKNYTRAAIELANDIILGSGGAVSEVFNRANAYATNAALAISQMFLKGGIVNVDFSTFSKIFSDNVGSGETAFSIASAQGESYIDSAIDNFKNCPLLVKNLDVKRAIVNFTCPPSFDILKLRESFARIAEILGNPQNIAFGAGIGIENRLDICAIGIGEIKVPAPDEMLEDDDSENRTDEKLDSAGNVTKNQNIEIDNQENLSETKEEQSENQKNVDTQELSKDEKSTKSGHGFFGFIRRRKKSEVETQDEFAFVDMSQQRGYFADTPPNMRGEEDLDVPTFMRKNIKIDI